jgi:ankyrin repeat protein
MFEAVHMNDLEEVKRLLKKGGVNINGQSLIDNRWITPFGMAVQEEGNLPIVNCLLAAKGRVNGSTGNGTPLEIAIQEGHLPIVVRLIAAGADTERALILAAKGGNLTIVGRLIVAGADLEDKDYDGKTALMWAAKEGHADVVDRLIEARADLEARDGKRETRLYPAESYQYGNTALIWAARGGHTPVMDRLIAAGVDLEARNDQGCTALLAAETSTTMQHLILAGANIKVTDTRGNGTLMLYIKRGGDASPPIMQRLIPAGKDVNIGNMVGDIPIVEAAKRDNLPMVQCLLAAGAVIRGHLPDVQYLMAAGADLKAADRDGKTALMWAAKEGALPALQYLVGAGADLETICKSRGTALMYATYEGHSPAVDHLIAAGANVTAKNSAGQTALYLAARRDYVGIVATILPHVARVIGSQELNALEGVERRSALDNSIFKEKVLRNLHMDERHN